MTDSADLSQLDVRVRQVLSTVCLFFHSLGIEKIHVGGLMRVLGVSEEIAAAYDGEYLIVDQELLEWLKSEQSKIIMDHMSDSQNTRLH